MIPRKFSAYVPPSGNGNQATAPSPLPVKADQLQAIVEASRAREAKISLFNAKVAQLMSYGKLTRQQACARIAKSDPQCHADYIAATNGQAAAAKRMQQMARTVGK